MTLRLLPSLICQAVIADNSESDCGWGAGVELIQQGITGPGQFNGRFDFEEVGGISRIGGQI